MLSPIYWLKWVTSSDDEAELEVAWDAAASAGLTVDCEKATCRHVFLPFSCVANGLEDHVQVNLGRTSKRRVESIYQQLHGLPPAQRLQRRSWGELDGESDED